MNWFWEEESSVKLCIPQREEAENILLLGDPGVGKSCIIDSFLSQIAARKETAIVLDLESEHVTKFYTKQHGDIILNPLDRRFPYWNLLAEITKETDPELIVESLFPGREEPQGSEKFFLEGKRALFATMLRHARTNEDLIQFLTNKNLIDRMMVGTEYESLVSQNAPQQRDGVLGDLSLVGKILRLLPSSRECTGNFSLTKWAAQRNGWLFLTATQDTEKQLLPLYALYLDVVMKRLMSPESSASQKTWIIADEAHALGRLSALYTCAVRGRKRAICLVIGTQNKAQIEHHYGKNAATLLSAPHLKVFFRSNEPNSAEWISKSIGNEERMVPRYGTSHSVQQQGRSESENWTINPEKRPVVSPEEIMALPNLHGYWKFRDVVVPFQITPPRFSATVPGFIARLESTQKQIPGESALLQAQKNDQSEAGLDPSTAAKKQAESPVSNSTVPQKSQSKSEETPVNPQDDKYLF